MRRQVIPQAAYVAWQAIICRLAQFSHLADQQINLLLLANDDLVELLQQVFGETGLDLQLGQALVYNL